MSKEPRTIEYRPLADLTPDPRNPKRHALETLGDSVDRFGFVEPIIVDSRTGWIISGHGRTKTLQAMEGRGDSPPDGITVGPGGEWLAPVVTGWASHSDLEAAGALITLNRTGEVGGWVDGELLDLLGKVAESADGLAGVGYDDGDIDALRASLATEEQSRECAGDGYSWKTDVPQYEIQGDEPEPQDLYDTTKADALQASIVDVDVSPELAAFLTAAARRHTVFNYARIAEYYAHASPPVQQLMEESALVIIDVEDAIRLGYAKLAERITALREAVPGKLDA